MNKVFIDFDGVILDTWSIFLNIYIKKYNTSNLIETKIKEIMINSDWKHILEDSPVICDNINTFIKLSKEFDMTVLSKVNSKLEKQSKKNFLMNNNINKFKFINYNENKSKAVNAKGNFLVDDGISNLDDWYEKGGISIFFNKNGENIDSYGKQNKKYPLIDNLLSLYDIIIMYK